jgi:5-methylcytosine-specific restriction endonuclease McrA
VVPIEVDSSLIDDVDNLVTCCRNCHQIKTRWEEDYYGTGLHNTKTGNPEIHSIATISEMMNACKGS